MKGSWRQRCGARAKHKKARAAGKLRGLHPFCRKWAVPGKRRCHLHGGLSTGPKTPEGKARTLAAMLEGRRRRIAEFASQGREINTGHNGGRPPKGRQRPPAGEQQIETQTMAAEQKGHDREDRAAGERRSDLWIAPQRFLDSHSARPRPELGPRYIRPAGRRSRDELPGFQGAQCRNHAGCQAGVISGVTRARSAPRQSRRTHGMKVTVDGCGRCRVRVTSV